MEKFKSFEELCQMKGVNPAEILPDVTSWPEHMRASILAQFKVQYMVEAANTDEDGKVWRPNWSDRNEYKYCPWWGVQADSSSGSGFGFAHCVYYYVLTNTILGSRLYFRSSEWAQFAGENWKEYEVMILG